MNKSPSSYTQEKRKNSEDIRKPGVMMGAWPRMMSCYCLRGVSRSAVPWPSTQSYEDVNIVGAQRIGFRFDQLQQPGVVHSDLLSKETTPGFGDAPTNHSFNKKDPYINLCRRWYTFGGLDPSTGKGSRCFPTKSETRGHPCFPSERVPPQR